MKKDLSGSPSRRRLVENNEGNKKEKKKWKKVCESSVYIQALNDDVVVVVRRVRVFSPSPACCDGRDILSAGCSVLG